MSDAATVTIGELPAQAICGVSAFRGRSAAALSVVEAETARHSGQFWAIAPGRFLCIAGAETGLGAGLRAAADGVVAITDQSDQWTTFRVAGEAARNVLARCVPIDLDRLEPGEFRLTRAGHLDVRLHFERDASAYTIAVGRSYAGSLLHALRAAARQDSHDR